MLSIKNTQDKLFLIAFLIVSIAVLTITGVRSFLLPITHDEAASFYYYIQTGEFLPYLSHVDANNHVLNSFLSWICFTFFGDSPFSLRVPNLLAIVVLAIAVWRISIHLHNTLSKYILVGGLLISFHWLSFYSVTRGYGLSMSLLVLGISYLMDYFKKEGIKNIAFGYLFIQLALSANLILIIAIVLLTLFVLLFQFLKKKLFKIENIAVNIFQFVLILFWFLFSIHLQNNNALYYGEGESYLQVTFVSLINLLTGTDQVYLTMLILFVSIALIITSLILNVKKIKNPIELFATPSLLFSSIITLLIIAFFLMKIILGINYPEDRTGLFFYLFFILILAFTLDQLKPVFLKIAGFPVIVLFLSHFLFSFNITKHSLVNYETIPDRFYTRLVEEQKLHSEKITIGGHRMTELFFAFNNYRNNGFLNLADPAETMQLNCDYSISNKKNQAYYKDYYTELDEDLDWGFTLLKRKETIQRNLIGSVDTLEWMQGYAEFFEFFALSDTSFENQNPLLASFDLKIDYIEKPFKGWLVFSIEGDQGSYYKRIPLNWLKYNWHNSTLNYQLISGPIPGKINKIVCYLWNSGQQNIKFRLNGLKIYQLDGPGVSIVIPEAI
ncbi:MAG: hypothetical protein H0V01_02660 [Bacteroidetes bacterium]|nr:hypothetical protein [Bacteroidota bacterium]HET6244711.1 hypothetical protein [Bacteroidia bacterium]